MSQRFVGNSPFTLLIKNGSLAKNTAILDS